MMDDEGYVCFLGRSDDLIMSAGYRIALGEIEDCLLNHLAVKAAAVIGVPDEQRNWVSSPNRIRGFLAHDDDRQNYAPTIM